MKIVLKYLGNKEDCYPYNKTKRIVSLLENNLRFEEDLIKIRKKFNIPSSGYKTDDDYVSGLSKLTNSDYSELLNELQLLSKKYNLPQWLNSIGDFVFSGVFYIPQRNLRLFPLKPENDYPRIDYFKDIIDKKEILIYVGERVTQAEFIRFIRSKWKQIDERISKYSELPENKMTRIVLARQVAYYREIKKYSFSKISKLLEKHPANREDYDSIDENYLRVLYYRWKKKVITVT
jgi:hypothetical protein